MKKHIAKGIAGIALAGAGVFGGIQIEQTQVDTLQSENVQLESVKQMLIAAVDSEKAVKENAADAYVYAMISSGRKPTLDVMPILDLEAAYVRTVGETNLADTDLYQKGLGLAKLRGDYICK